MTLTLVSLQLNCFLHDFILPRYLFEKFIVAVFVTEFSVFK